MFARTNSNRIIDYVQNNEKSLIVVHSTRQTFEQILLVSFMHKCYGKLEDEVKNQFFGLLFLSRASGCCRISISMWCIKLQNTS